MSGVPSPVILMHKPKGLIVTRSDERGRKTVYDGMPAFVRDEGWIPVGRLDLDSRGLLLFVRDGRVMDRLTRPGACLKTYEVTVRGQVDDEHLKAMRQGVASPVGLLRAVAVEVLSRVGPKSRVRVQLDEGKNRHIRRMFGALKDRRHGTPLKVLALKRIGFGTLALDLPLGGWRFASRAECEALGIPCAP